MDECIFILIFIGHACGRFVSAGRIDEACRAFGFPFQQLKSCQEMECLCMKFQAPLFCENRGAEYASTCNACGHDEKRHFKVEKCGSNFFNACC